MIALLLALACGTGEPPAPQPLRYSVVRGDTLFLIAKAHGVSVDQLRAWNGLEGDLIEVGQIIEIREGSEPAPAPRPRARRSSKPAPAPTTGGTADLSLPPEKPCLAGPSEVVGDEGMAASEGLSSEQVRGAMGAFVHNTLRCIPGEFSPDAPLTLELTVACTGRVSEVSIADAGGWPDEVAQCVRSVLGFTPFPAHDLPDGETVRYPLRYTPPE